MKVKGSILRFIFLLLLQVDISLLSTRYHEGHIYQLSSRINEF